MKEPWEKGYALREALTTAWLILVTLGSAAGLGLLVWLIAYKVSGVPGP